MRLLIKELEPTDGRIRVAGHELARDHPQAGALLPAQHRRGVPGLQAAAQPDGVRERRLRAPGHRQRPRSEIRAKVPDILRLTGLSTKLHNYPDQLSGGEQQRVSIARAFVNHPPLLLADEPTGNLDPETTIEIMRLLYRINRTGTTVLVATHDQAMVDKMRRRVIELSRGRIVRDEASGPVRARRDDARVRAAAARSRDTSARGLEAMRLGFFLREALRAMRRNAAPALRRPGHRARDDARARRLHPDRAGHQRRRQQVRGRVMSTST